MAVVSADGVLSLHRIKRDSNSSSQFQQERAENQQSLQPPSPRTIDILDTKTPSKSTDVNSLLLREIHEQVRSHKFSCGIISQRINMQNKIEFPLVGGFYMNLIAKVFPTLCHFLRWRAFATRCEAACASTAAGLELFSESFVTLSPRFGGAGEFCS